MERRPLACLCGGISRSIITAFNLDTTRNEEKAKRNILNESSANRGPLALAPLGIAPIRQRRESKKHSAGRETT
jgi:hypothetical protein